MTLQCRAQRAACFFGGRRACDDYHICRRELRAVVAERFSDLAFYHVAHDSFG